MTLPEGDGLSIRVSSTYIAAHADIHRSREFYGNPVGSSSIRDNSANELLARLIADLALKPTHVPVFIDANGMTTWQNAAAPSQPDTWLASLWGYVAQIKAIGAKVAVGTVPAQFNPNSPARKDAFNCRRAVVKAAIRRAVGSKIDAVIDIASNTAIAIDAAPCDPTYFLDPVHPTGADHGRMYAIYRPGLDAMLGNPTLAPPAAVSSNFDTAA